MRDLKHAAGAWVTELPSVLWGLRTTPNWSTDRTPFFMVYGAEVVVLSDLLHNAPEWNSSQKLKQNRHIKTQLIS